MKRKDATPELNLDRMVRSATAGMAGEPYCSLIVDCLWQTPTWQAMTVADLYAFWVEAQESDLTVAEFISLKQKEFA